MICLYTRNQTINTNKKTNKTNKTKNKQNKQKSKTKKNLQKQKTMSNITTKPQKPQNVDMDLRSYSAVKSLPSGAKIILEL